MKRLEECQRLAVNLLEIQLHDQTLVWLSAQNKFKEQETIEGRVEKARLIKKAKG